MIRQLWGLLCLIVFLGTVGVSAQEAPAPYIYYFSDILHGIVIERADGTDSRLIGQDVIPEGHDSIGVLEWSASGRWFVFSSGQKLYDHVDYETWGIFSSDGETFISLDKANDLAWSPVDDYLFYKSNGRSKIFDPVTHTYLFDEPTLGLGGVPCRSRGYDCIAWNPDGTAIVFRSYDWQQQVYSLSKLSLPDFTVDVRVFSVKQQVDGDGVSHLILYIDSDNQLVIYNVFTDEKRTYPFQLLAENQSIKVYWNAQYSQAFLLLSTNLSPEPNRSELFWLALESDELVRVDDIPLNTNSCHSDCLVWSPEGDKAFHDTNSGDLYTIFTPSLEVKMLDGINPNWADNNHVITEDALFDVINSQLIKTLNRNGVWGAGRLSPNQHYISQGGIVYDFSTDETIARSRTSGEIGSVDTSWHETSDWVMLELVEFFPCCGIHSSFYEMVHLNSTTTRELTNCRGSKCADWLPERVEPFLSQNASPTPILPAYTDVFYVEGRVERLAWSPDGTQLAVVTWVGDDEVSQYTVWDVATKQKISQTEISSCRSYCELDWDIDFSRPIERDGMHFINRMGTLELTYGEASQTYSIRNLSTNVILYSWANDAIHPDSPFNDDQFRWVGETLFILFKGINCYQYWYETSLKATPDFRGCEFSDYNDDYALLFFPMGTKRTDLMDTLTGEIAIVNFYGRDASFHPDGTHFALGSKNMITFWNIEDVMRNAQTPE